MELNQNRLNSIKIDKGSETKAVVKRNLLTVSLFAYLFPLNTYRCAQSVATVRW